MDEQALAAGLRSFGRVYRRECRGRRVHPTVLHLGTLSGERVEIPHDPTLDPALRADLLERILNQVDPAVALPWLTRGGVLAPGDNDFAWYAAARTAFGRHGRTLSAFYLITRDGWLDLVTDRSDLWVAPPPSG